MHEAAMQNVLELKVSVWDLEPQHVSWVLMRKHLWIDRLPMLGEQIRVFTTPAGFRRAFTFRDYIIYDQQGHRIAAASSTWLLMDTRHRKMANLLPFLKKFEPEMPSPEDCLPRPESKMPSFEKADRSLSFRVDWHDLDFNNHLSNTRYLQWMLEIIPRERLDGNFPRSMRIEYRAEARLGDELIAEGCQTDDTGFLHQLRLKDSDKILASAVSEWERS